MAEKTVNITNLDVLKNYAKGQIVELPPFAEGMPFVARLRRPSMLALAKSGKIPNSLLRSANELFMGKTKREEAIDDNSMAQLMEIFDILCESSFVEPTYQDIKNSGIELTDEQYTFIFNYSQNGIKALESFRQERTNS